MNLKDLINLSPEDLIKQVEKGGIADAMVYTLPLDTAFTNFQVEIAGNLIACIYGGDTAGTLDTTVNVDIQFNRIEPNAGNKVNFSQGLQMVRPFARLFVTSTAQAGKVIKFLIASTAPLFEVRDYRASGATATILSTIATNTGNTVTQDTAVKNNTRSLNGDTGTQIAVSGLANSSTTVLWTVTAAKTGYLSHINICNAFQNTSAACYLEVTNAAGVVQYTILAMVNTGGLNAPITVIDLSNPLVIPTGFKVQLRSVDANSYPKAFLKAWEE